MTENIDLTKILDGCPVGTEFYNDTFGKLFFLCIKSEINPFGVIFKDCHDISWAFTEKGTYYTNEDSKCSVSVFPSKDQRDWSKFERFWDKPNINRFNPKTLQSFDKVLVRDDKTDIWHCEMFSHIRSNDAYPYFCAGNPYRYCIPFNDETKHLAGTTKEAPDHYVYWEEE